MRTSLGRPGPGAFWGATGPCFGSRPVDDHIRSQCAAPGLLLRIPTGLPVQEIVRVGYSAKDHAAVEVTQVIIPSDRVEEVVRLQRDESAAWPHRDVGPDGPPVAP